MNIKKPFRFYILAGSVQMVVLRCGVKQGKRGKGVGLIVRGGG